MNCVLSPRVDMNVGREGFLRERGEMGLVKSWVSIFASSCWSGSSFFCLAYILWAIIYSELVLGGDREISGLHPLETNPWPSFDSSLPPPCWLHPLPAHTDAAFCPVSFQVLFFVVLLSFIAFSFMVAGWSPVWN